MELIDVALEMIESIGFPIFIAVVLLQQSNQNAKYYQETLYKFRETIDANTQTIQVLIRELRSKQGGD